MIANHKPDPITAKWMRDASDELAVRNGCTFDEGRGLFVVEWFRKYLRFYEGEAAGRSFELDPERGGIPWQYDVIMRLFGWVRYSDEYERDVRRFRKASLYCPKKNGKSPLLAGVCCYMTFGDGEMGAKSYPTAKNGIQIRQNVVRHIHEMIRQSPMLSAECTMNKGTGSVFHEPTRSLVQPLASDDERSQKALEGLNGNIFVDETHIVDKSHMDRIDRAGISRSEPLHMEVSTAGDEPESYGYAQFQRAEAIIAGRLEDDETLAVIYSAPQSIRDEDIHANPIKVGKLANPSWGFIVKEREFRSDYERSKRTPHSFGIFKKYRLDIWQQSACPWLSLHDWDACPATDLDAGALTYSGLDFSRTTDLTARVLYQPGDIPKCKGHYWVPRKRVAELEGQYEIPLSQWASEGWVTVSGESEIDREDIHKQLEADADEFKQLRHVGYDAYNIGNTEAWCRNELGWEMVIIKQSIVDQNLPCKELEGMVVSHSIDHCGDPVLRWMIGNTMVKPDTNDNIRPQKTVGGNRKHIDGVTALINAMAVALAQPPKKPSIYEMEGQLVL